MSRRFSTGWPPRPSEPLWLDDAFDETAPLIAPSLSGRINGDLGIDATDPARRDEDHVTITGTLGRDPFRW